MPEKNHSNLDNSLGRFREILTEAEQQEILALQKQPLPTGIRLNPLKVNPEEKIRDLSARYGWKIKPVPFCKYGWAIYEAETSPGGTIEHRMGQYYLQDVASMVPVSLFDSVEANIYPLILDMAASPGGKTNHLISRSKAHGFVIANDASKSRIPALRSVLTSWGGINQIITQYPGESFGAWYPETFDLVLLDAPCSMENLRPTPNHPLRETTPSERTRLVERQIQLLTSGMAALKTGGQLVYATCSLAPEEDEAVLDAVLRAFPKAIQIEEVSDRLRITAPGLTQFDGNAFHPVLSRALRLWPHRTGMSGFFCALIRKNGPIPIQKSTPPSRDFTKTELIPLKQDSAGEINNSLESGFGFDLEKILAQYNLSPYIRHDHVFLIPNQYLECFSTLPYEYIGMPLGRWDGKALEPAHEFISRFGHQFRWGIISIPEEKIAQWVEGRDIRRPPTKRNPQGQYLLVTDQNGRNLGLGKLLPKRLRNMLPRGSG
jgi:16S rRNA (cytosine1407-C5)-methyltransferase